MLYIFLFISTKNNDIQIFKNLNWNITIHMYGRSLDLFSYVAYYAVKLFEREIN